MVGKKILDWFAGKKALQGVFYGLYRMSVYGMNYGNSEMGDNGETYAAEYVRRRIEKKQGPFILFDVGANQGKYSARLASVFAKTDFRIHAFEPSRLTYDVLVKNTSSLEQVHTYSVGLSDSTETRTLFKRAEVSGFSSVYQRRLDHINMTMGLQEEIRLTTIDRFCEEQGIGHIHFLKMDVEGHEFSCLKGATRMLQSQAIDFIQFEFGGCNIDSRTYLQDYWYLLHEQYHFNRVVKNGLVRIDAYNERWEIFKNINFLLERKKF